MCEKFKEKKNKMKYKQIDYVRIRQDEKRKNKLQKPECEK